MLDRDEVSLASYLLFTALERCVFFQRIYFMCLNVMLPYSNLVVAFTYLW